MTVRADSSRELSVDCLYNEELEEPLADTLKYHMNDTTLALVVVELRSDSVTRAFLEAILGDGDLLMHRVKRNCFGDNPLRSTQFTVWCITRK